jgi:hypothetical protein
MHTYIIWKRVQRYIPAPRSALERVAAPLPHAAAGMPAAAGAASESVPIFKDMRSTCGFKEAFKRPSGESVRNLPPSSY